MSFLKRTVFTVFVYLFLFLIIPLEAKYFKNSHFEDTESLAKCIVAFANNDIYGKPTVIISNGDNNNEELNTMDKYVSTLTKLLTKALIPQILISDLQYLNETGGNYEKNLLIVLITQSCNSLRWLNETVYQKYRYLNIIEENLNKKCNRELINIGRKLQHLDATFILKDTINSKYNLYTTIPEIDENTCQYNNKITLTIVNTCTQGALKDRVVFPNKTPKNFKKCQFNVGIATMYPYAIAVQKESLHNFQSFNESQIRGSDVEIVKIISDYYNASLKLYYIYREEENPFFHQDFVQLLVNGSLDACAGGLYRIYGDLVSYSGIYMKQAVFWVYAVERAPRTWQTVVSNVNGLYVFILFYIGYSITWILFCNYDHIPVYPINTLLHGWGALLGTSSLQQAVTWKQKILNISYLLLCLHLSAYLSVHLYSFFTIQGPPQILKTNDDVMKSGRTPYLNPDTKYFVEDAKYKAFANTSKDCSDFRDCEQKMLINRGVTVTLEGNFYPLQAATAIDDEARVLRAWENILIAYHEMIVSKGSPFASKFKLIIQRLFEAGICERLFLEATGLLFEAKGENANANIMANSYSCICGCAIDMSQIAGVLYIWIVGCGLSFVVFIIEVMMYKDSTFNTI